MHTFTRTSALILLTLGLATRAFAAVDPTSEQIYQAAQSGHLQQAEQMIGQVLQNHPKSGKAHYVAAEVYAKEGRIADARRELSTAREIAPGLPFANAASVAALQKQLAGPSSNAIVVSPPQSRSVVPWGMLLLVGGGLAVVWLLVRPRREPVPMYSGAPVPAGTTTVLGGTPMGGGIGSGIAGGLASGLAVGAGVVAGEALARRFLDDDRNEHLVVNPEREPVESVANSDMGGDDFGLNADSSWDDSSGGGGGDDWT